MTLSEYALKFIGRPYIWGGDGSGRCGGGFDCSGLVLECLWAFGKIDAKDRTAQRLHDYLREKWYRELLKEFIAANDVLFFGKDLHHITHVAIAINNYLMVEAGGGSSKCKTPATSTGMVRVRPIVSRKDFVAALREP